MGFHIYAGLPEGTDLETRGTPPSRHLRSEGIAILSCATPQVLALVTGEHVNAQHCGIQPWTKT